MPDRQRHGRLSDRFTRLFAARSEQPPASGRRGSAPAGPAARFDEPFPPEPFPNEPFLHEPVSPSHDAPAGERTPTSGPQEPVWPSGPVWPGESGDPGAEPAELSRPAWQLAAMQGREADQADKADRADWVDHPGHPDPMAETTLLKRVVLPLPVEEPAAAYSGPDTGLDPDFSTAAVAAVAAGSAASAGPAGPAADGSPRSRFTRSPLLQQRRRLAVGLAGIAALGALLALPPVRAELRDSFTRKPQPYTALYFPSRPQVDGTVLTVPVSVHAVDTGTDAYSVHVWTVDAKGQTNDSRQAVLTWDGQAMSTVVSMPVSPAAEYVWVSLNGSGQTLHYKIAVA